MRVEDYKCLAKYGLDTPNQWRLSLLVERPFDEPDEYPPLYVIHRWDQPHEWVFSSYNQVTRDMFERTVRAFQDIYAKGYHRGWQDSGSNVMRNLEGGREPSN